MNRRQKKKLDKKVLNAIIELNNDILLDEGLPPISMKSAMETLEYVKKQEDGVRRTLEDYKKHIKG